MTFSRAKGIFTAIQNLFSNKKNYLLVELKLIQTVQMLENNLQVETKLKKGKIFKEISVRKVGGSF